MLDDISNLFVDKLYVVKTSLGNISKKKYKNYFFFFFTIIIYTSIKYGAIYI